MPTTPTATGPRPHRPTFSARLEREWRRRSRRPDDIARARGWEVTRCEFDHLDELLGHVGYGQPTSVQHETALRALLVIARNDELAALVVLRRIMPGLLAVVRRRAGRSFHADGRLDLLEELVGAAWITIRTYDPDRRPACLAAALICGAEHRAFRAAERRRSADEQPIDPVTAHQLPDPSTPSSDDELAEVLRDARRAGMHDEVDFVRSYVRATSTDELAAALSVSPRTVRNRRAAATRRLRQVAVAR